MVNLCLPSMATRTMIFGFIRSKTMAGFRKGTWKVRENRLLYALLVVKLFLTLKHVININSQNKFHCFMNVPESDAGASSFFFFFSRRRITDVFSRA